MGVNNRLLLSKQEEPLRNAFNFSLKQQKISAPSRLFCFPDVSKYSFGLP